MTKAAWAVVAVGVTTGGHSCKKSLGDEAAAWGRKAEMTKEGGDAGRWFGVDFVAVLSVTPKNFTQDASPREKNNNNGFGPESLFSGFQLLFLFFANEASE